MEGGIYHGDDGKLFNQNPQGVDFGPKWRNCDIIECGVKFREILSITVITMNNCFEKD